MTGVALTALQEQLRAGFARATPLAERYRREISESGTSRPTTSATPWAGSARADAVLALAQACYAGVGRAAWRDEATPEDWAAAYRHAQAMRGHDPLAARVHARVEEEVRRRFDVDIRETLLRDTGAGKPDAGARRRAQRAAEPAAGAARPSGSGSARLAPPPAVSSEELRLAWGAAQLAALGFAQPAAEAVRHSRRSRALEVGRVVDPVDRLGQAGA